MLLLDPQEVLRLEVGMFFVLDESPIVGETRLPMGGGLMEWEIGVSRTKRAARQLKK